MKVVTLPKLQQPLCPPPNDMPSVLERLTSFPTALPVSLQLSLLHYLFAMRDAFTMFPFGDLLLLELPYCHWSFLDLRGALQSSLEFPSLLRSSPVFARAPPCPPEFLLLPQSPFPSEFFGDSLWGFPCLLRAFLLSPMTLLLHHSFAAL